MSFIVKGSKIINANSHLKKLSLKGVKWLLYANLPVKKLPDQKKDAKVNRKKANITFLFIFYLSTRVIKEEVSNLLPPFSWINL